MYFVPVLSTLIGTSHLWLLSLRLETSIALGLKCEHGVQLISRVRLFATLWTVAHQAPPSMGFLQQEYWIGLPFPSPGDLPDPGIEPVSPGSPALQAVSLPLSHCRCHCSV